MIIPEALTFISITNKPSAAASSLKTDSYLSVQEFPHGTQRFNVVI